METRLEIVKEILATVERLQQLGDSPSSIKATYLIILL